MDKNKIIIGNEDDAPKMDDFGKHRFIVLSVLLLMVFSVSAYLINVAHLAGIDSTDISITLANEAISASSQMDVVFTFGTLNNGDGIEIYLGETTGGNNWDMTGVLTTDVVCSDNGAGESYSTTSVNSATANTPAYVECTATTVGAGATAVTVQIGSANDPTNPSVAGGYSISIVTDNDSGAAVAYVGNSNDIVVNAEVLPNLTIDIDNADGTTCTTSSNITICNMGIVTTAAVNTGYYDVNGGTNATNGATIRINENQDISSGGDTISDIVEDTGGTVTAGVEEYGIQVDADAGSWTELGDFTDDDTPIPGATTAVASTAGPIANSGDDVTVTHRIAIASSTEAGNYNHSVTWTAIADF